MGMVSENLRIGQIAQKHRFTPASDNENANEQIENVHTGGQTLSQEEGGGGFCCAMWPLEIAHNDDESRRRQKDKRKIIFTHNEVNASLKSFVCPQHFRIHLGLPRVYIAEAPSNAKLFVLLLHVCVCVFAFALGAIWCYCPHTQ